MTTKEPDAERMALLDAFRIIDSELWGNRPRSDETKAHIERWIEWALKGRTTGRLRKGISDSLEPLVAHPPEVRAALTAKVRTATGIDLNSFRQAHLRRIAAILERGQVRTITEYESLREHVDELEGDLTRAADLVVAYRLIGDFEISYAQRGKRR
jgi:hypothetical protein